MCYTKTKDKRKKMFLLAQFKLFDKDDNLIYTGGKNIRNFDLWKETDIEDNETFIGLRCALSDDTGEIMGLGIVTVSYSEGQKS